MENREDIKKELEELSPLLAARKRQKKDFQVPYQYFERLPDRILKEVNTSSEIPTNTSWGNKINFFLGYFFQQRTLVGFASALFLFVGGYLLLQKQSFTSSSNLAELTAIEISQYIATNVDEFEEDLLYDLSEENTSFDLENISQEEENQLFEMILNEVDVESLEELL